jgi:hypothetical protein
MKPRLSNLSLLAAIILSAAQSSGAAPAASLARPEMPKSVFTIPESTAQGHDPFFPYSMRPYANKSTAKASNAPSLTDLVVKSILPSGDRVFAIINNHTFAPGDEGTVLTRDGQRMTVRCLAINREAGTVTVESEGVRAVLRFGNP